MIGRLATALLLLLAAAPAASTLPGFSHEVHAKNFERSCSECHVQPARGLPTLRTEACAECHEATPAYAANAKAPSIGLGFRHEPHARTAECLECHQAVLGPKRNAEEPLLERSQCAACHGRRGATWADRRCADCHGGDERQVRPADHDRAWLTRHGDEGKDRAFEKHGQRCGLCHGEDACVGCHRERAPASHTGLWRVRLHGSAAGWDREGCRTCHETGTCVRCHQTTRPLNHVGAWPAVHGLAAGATDNEGCRACHSAAQCTACHRAGL